MDLILKINEHIENFIKPHTDDEAILAFQPSRINLKWAYFGIWNPVKIIIEFVSRISLLKKVSHRYAEKTMKGTDNKAT